MYAYGYYQAGPVEPISPPSSPDLNEELNYDISPIDQDDDVEWDFPQQYYLRSEESSPPSKQQQQHIPIEESPPSDPFHQRSRASSAASSQKPKSNIPAMRRERRKLQDAAAKASREQRLIQHKNPNNTSSVSPANQRTDLLDEAARGRTLGIPEDPTQKYGSTTTITSNNQQHRRYNTSPSFGERMRQFGKGKADAIESRPPWNGSSGRQALVEPMRDDIHAAPLGAHLRNGNRSADRNKAAQPAGAETSYSGAAAAAMRKFMPARASQMLDKTDTPHFQQDPATHSASSSVPLAAPTPTRNGPGIRSHHETHQNGLSPDGHPHRDFPDQEKAIKRKPPPSTLQPHIPTHTAHLSISSSVYSTQPETRAFTESPQLDLYQSSEGSTITGPWAYPPPQPAPAFSSESTTPSTSSPASPQPTPENDHGPQIGNIAPSVMDRRRPLRGKESPKETSDDPVVISLKTASYAKAAAEAERRAENDDRPPSVMSTGKDLPLAPPEMLESDDRVAVLNAKLLGLAHRRNNINRSIQQMTELMPKDRLLESADVQRKREEEKRKVDHLKEELADIQQQEFDLGLKLHRAYKRRDREAEFDSGGTLWIRRITS